MERSEHSLFQQYLGWGLAVSILVHLLVLTGSKNPWQSREAPLQVFDVSLANFEPPVRDQIVSPPDPSVPEREPEHARFRSDRAASVPREQVRRGDGEDAGPVANENPSRAPSRSPAPSAAAKARGEGQERLQLKLSSDELLTGIERAEQSERSRAPQQESRSLSSYEPFSRPSGSGARFLGLRGTNDFLPNLPDGDVTLLNAKADKYAVFVRRIAVQVFTELRSSGWESLSPAEVRSAPDFATVIGVMDTSGNFLRAYIERSSGSYRFDDLLRRAATRGTIDKNPPAGAEAPDGKIYFIFQARSWSRGAINPRSGAPTERRWLLLGTGLK